MVTYTCLHIVMELKIEVAVSIPHSRTQLFYNLNLVAFNDLSI